MEKFKAEQLWLNYLKLVGLLRVKKNKINIRNYESIRIN